MAKIELKRLSEVYTMTPNPKTKERVEKFPGYYSIWCTFLPAHFCLGLKDTVLLVHGSQGCIGNVRTFLSTYVSQYFGNPFVFSPTTDMNFTDAILGAEDKLKESILEVNRIYKPKLILVMLTCAPGVIKEAVEDIVERTKDHIDAKIMLLRTEGFTQYSHGMIQIYISQKLSELFEEPKGKNSKSVNILGISKEVPHPGKFPVDSNELERLLNKMDIKVNSVLLQAAALEDFKKASEAEYNVFDCPLWGYPLANAMSEKFGIPHGKRFNPLGVTEISNWLIEIAEFFGVERKAKELIKEEYAQIKEVWEEAKRLVDGKIILIDGGDPMAYVGRSIAYGRMCRDLGMEAILFNVSPIEVKGNIYNVEGALEQGYDPKIVYSDYAYHRRFSPMQVIEGLGLNFEDVALYIGDVYPTAISQWDKPIFDPSNSPRLITTTHCSRRRQSPGKRIGFKGAEEFARSVINVVKMARRGDRPSLYGRVWGLK